jgi:DNA modification methylase
MRQPSTRAQQPQLVARRAIVAYLPIGSIVPDPSNPRKHSPEQIRAIARSIKAFGFNAPILVDKANRIVAGHGRLDAANLLGLAEAPVIRLDHLSERQAKAFMLADNKLTDRSSWDDRKVAIVLKELSDITLDFEIRATGFEPPEIDLRIQSLESPNASTESSDEVEVPDGPPVSRPGDLWTLGKHRLLCGNALDPQAYDALLAGEKAAAVFTDLRYSMPGGGRVTGNGEKEHREFPIAAGEVTEEEFCNFFVNAFVAMASNSVDRATFFACIDWRRLFEIIRALRVSGCLLLDICVWVMTSEGVGSLYPSRRELVFVFRRRDATRINVQLGKNGRKRTNVWNYRGTNASARCGQPGGDPTVPTAMVSDAILDVTRRDDIVLDPFSGSGTTILAAERTGRRGYAIEFNPSRVDTAIARWQRLTKQTAIHANGKSFEEMRTERIREDGGA